jgi:uncharacterized protein YxjI
LDVNLEQLTDKVIESRNQGFSDQEIRAAMKQDGIQDRMIDQALKRADRRVQNQRRNQRNNPGQARKGQRRGQSQNSQGRNTQRKRRQPTGNNRSQQNSPPANRSQGNPQGSRNQNFQNQSQAGGRNEDQQVISRINLTDDSYTVKQKFFSIRDQYKVYDDGEEIMRAKRKLFKLKEDIVFKDYDQNEIFEIKAEQIQDIAGDYTVVDSETDEPVVVLEKDFTLATHKWEVKSPDNRELMAHVESKSAAVSWLRVLGGYVPGVPNVFALIPHGYYIQDPDGNQMGEISGHFHIKDIYDIEIENSGKAPREALVAAAVAVDTLEGN